MVLTPQICNNGVKLIRGIGVDMGGKESEFVKEKREEKDMNETYLQRYSIEGNSTYKEQGK